MATLTPLSKAIVGLAVVGAVSSAVWHLGLKEQFANGGGSSPPAVAPAAGQITPGSATTLAVPETPPAPVAMTSKGAVETPAPAPVKTGPVQGTAAENAENGRRLLERGEHAQARVYLEAAIQAGDGGAACHLGEMTLRGQGGIPASRDNAAKLFQLAQSRNIICFTTGN